jgi:hypothetical protein
VPLGYKKQVGKYSLKIVQSMKGPYWLIVNGVEAGMFSKPQDALADLAHGHITTVIAPDPESVFRSGDYDFSLELDEWTETEFPHWEDLK